MASVSQSVSQSHFATDGQSVSPFWRLEPSGTREEIVAVDKRVAV